MDLDGWIWMDGTSAHEEESIHYVRADLHAELMRAADELAGEVSIAIQNSNRIPGSHGPMVSLPLSSVQSLAESITSYEQAKENLK